MSKDDQITHELEHRLLKVRQEVIWHTLANVADGDKMTKRLKERLRNLEKEMQAKFPSADVEEKLESVVGGQWKEE